MTYYYAYPPRVEPCENSIFPKAQTYLYPAVASPSFGRTGTPPCLPMVGSVALPVAFIPVFGWAYPLPGLTRLRIRCGRQGRAFPRPTS